MSIFDTSAFFGGKDCFHAQFLYWFFAFDMPKLFFSLALSKIFFYSFTTIFFYFSEPDTWFLFICLCQLWWIIFLYGWFLKLLLPFNGHFFFPRRYRYFWLCHRSDYLIRGPREVGRTQTQNRKIGTPPPMGHFCTHTPKMSRFWVAHLTQ